jgi:hypothetical protein
MEYGVDLAHEVQGRQGRQGRVSAAEVWMLLLWIHLWMLCGWTHPGNVI